MGVHYSLMGLLKLLYLWVQTWINIEASTLQRDAKNQKPATVRKHNKHPVIVAFPMSILFGDGFSALGGHPISASIWWCLLRTKPSNNGTYSDESHPPSMDPLKWSHTCINALYTMLYSTMVSEKVLNAGRKRLITRFRGYAIFK